MLAIIIFIVVAAICIAIGNANGEGNQDERPVDTPGCACGDAIYVPELKRFRHDWNPKCPVHLTRW
jgi:hypothetical protein